MGLFSNGFEFVIVIDLVKSSRTPSVYDIFFHCRLVFRGTLSYGLNQQLNQESDINKKGKILDLVEKVAWLESYRIVKNKLTNGLDL